MRTPAHATAFADLPPPVTIVSVKPLAAALRDGRLQSNARSIAQSCLGFLRTDLGRIDADPQPESREMRIVRAQAKAHAMLIGARTMAQDVDPAAYALLGRLAQAVLSSTMRDQPTATIARLLSDLEARQP